MRELYTNPEGLFQDARITYERKVTTFTSTHVSTLMPVVFVILAIGSGVNMEEINGIANNEDYVFHANSYGEVQSLTDVIADKICSKGKHLKYLLCRSDTVYMVCS